MKLKIVSIIIIAAIPLIGSVAILNKLTLQKEINHGYGCGGNCSFLFKGKSNVLMTYQGNKSIVVKDSGSGLKMEYYPDDTSNTVTTWNVTYNGTWTGNDTERVLKLNAASSLCEERRESSKERKTKICSIPPKLEIKCLIEDIEVFNRIPVSSKVKGTSTKAVICKQIGLPADYSGTEFPWIFGIGKSIKTVKTGQPHAKIYYIFQ